MGAADGLFLPGLMSLLGHRALKADARDTLVGYGETDRQRARSRAAGPPRAHLAAPPHSQDAGADPDAGVDGRARRRARRARRLPALQGDCRDRAAGAGPSGIAFPRAAVEKLLAGRDLALLQQPDPARQPAAARPRRPGVAAGPRPHRQDGAGPRPHLPLARSALPDRRRRGGALRHRARRRAAARPGDRVPRQPARRPRQAPRAAAARRHAAGRQGAPRQRAAQEPPARARRHAGPARSRRRRRRGGLGDPLRRPGAAGGRWRTTSSTSSPIADAATPPSSKPRTGRCGSGRSPIRPATPGRRSRPWSWWTACAPSRSSSSCRWTSCSGSRPSAKRSGTRAGRELFRAGAPASYVEFLLEGAVADDDRRHRRRRPSSASTRCSRARRAASTIRASGPLVCLRIAAADLLTVLSDNVQLAQGLFRMLLAPAGNRRAPLRPADIDRDGPVADAAHGAGAAPALRAGLGAAAAGADVGDGGGAAGRGRLALPRRRHAGRLRGDERGGRARSARAGRRSPSGPARRSASPRRSRASAPGPAPPSPSRGAPCAWIASRCSMCSATTLS